ncbi:MAG: YaiI/YqxD family protein [Candidatus Eisenbacteria bacterium]
MIRILVDADACPVKPEVYKVAARYDLPVLVVSNIPMRTPREGRVELVLVGDGMDEADDKIVLLAGPEDIVITADIPLAARAVAKGARALGPKGREFTEESVGDTLATRDLMTHLREAGSVTGGPAPFAKKDRSRFLDCLDRIVQALRRGTGPPAAGGTAP